MFTFHQAVRDDAEQIADILISSFGGLAEQLFNGLIPGLDCRTILSAALMKGEGVYSVENIICSREKGRLTSLLFSYPAEEHKVPPIMESLLPAKRLNPVRLILESSIPDSLYINTLWQGNSLGNTGLLDALLVEAETRCNSFGRVSMSLFCWNDHQENMQYYTDRGFVVAQHIPYESASVPGHESGASLLCKVLEEV